MKGVLLINLGSPESPTAKDVKPYLGEFLMDERVIDVPKWFRTFLVKGIILNTRPKKSAAAYQKIWWPEGSPLVVISERFAKKVQQQLEIPVTLGMRYGKMSIAKALKELEGQGVSEVFVLPLYPQYAMSSYETVAVKVEEVAQKEFPQMKLFIKEAFYKEPNYIKVLSKDIANKLKGVDFDHLLFSYHGIPERHIKKTDPTKSHCAIDGSCCVTDSVAHTKCYRHQCMTTTELVRKELELPADKVSHSFQSRLGSDAWLKPYTDKEFERLATSGTKKLVVVTPAFVADCLETLEEIAMEGKEQFIEAGGESFHHISCLNDSDDWAQTVVDWVNEWRK
jgi:ferrochelatase